MGTHQKRLDAARKRRRQIASQLRMLKTGKLALENVLEAPPESLGRVSIYQVMIHSAKMGPAGTKKVLQKVHVWPEDPLDKLTREQLDAILRELPPRARHYRESA